MEKELINQTDSRYEFMQALPPSYGVYIAAPLQELGPDHLLCMSSCSFTVRVSILSEISILLPLIP